MVSFSYPERHTLSHVAPQKRQNLWHKNIHSCPLCSCTPEDMCRIPHTHSHLMWKRTEEIWSWWRKRTRGQDRLWALPSHMCFSVALGLYPGLHEQSKPPSFRSVQLCSQILSLHVCVLPRSNRRKVCKKSSPTFLWCQEPRKLLQSELLTTAKLIRLVPTIIIIIAGVRQWDAVSITAFVLFICARAVRRAQALVQGNTGTLKTGCTYSMNIYTHSIYETSATNYHTHSFPVSHQSRLHSH